MTLVECHSPVLTRSLDGSVVRVEWSFVAGPRPNGRSDSRRSEGRLVLAATISNGATQVSAWSELDDTTRPLLQEVPATAKVTRVAGHLHVDLFECFERSTPATSPRGTGRAVDASRSEAPLLSMVLDGERAVYLRCNLPVLAGLKGGSYDLLAVQLRREACGGSGGAGTWHYSAPCNPTVPPAQSPTGF